MATSSNNLADATPFILNFLEPLDNEACEQAVAEHHSAVQSYSPQTQTSDMDIWAGTSRTYKSTYCGLFGGKVDDSELEDT